jgi:hypothetical protein
MTQVKTPPPKDQTEQKPDNDQEKTELKNTQKPQAKTSSRGRKSVPVEITDEMKKSISTSAKLVKDGCSKMDAAREAYDQLSGYSRSQIIHVFMEGCSLSKAGASTYYQSIKQAKNKPK